jgi:hypothetical protein
LFDLAIKVPLHDEVILICVSLAPMDMFIKTIMAAFKLQNSHKSNFKHRIKFPQQSYETFNDKIGLWSMCPDITMVQILNWLGRGRCLWGMGGGEE